MKHFWNLFVITLWRKKLRFKFTLLRFETSFNFSCLLGDWQNSDVEERLIRLEKHVFGKGDNHEWHDHAVKKIIMDDDHSDINRDGLIRFCHQTSSVSIVLKLLWPIFPAPLQM